MHLRSQRKIADMLAYWEGKMGETRTYVVHAQTRRDHYQRVLKSLEAEVVEQLAVIAMYKNKLNDFE